jgi:NADP-dependent aldehyde dehydrogenase
VITTTNPRTGLVESTDIPETGTEDLDSMVADAGQAFEVLAGMGRTKRAGLLRAIADALEADREGLVRTADAETGLGVERLGGELSRTAFQFRMFSDAVLDGGFLEAAIDHAADTPLGPGPDLRRMLVPLGPVAVFGASNFPVAFSVAGGDTASALAAGCPVILKAHDSHPLTSQRSFERMRAALVAGGVPAGTVGLVFGQTAAGQLVKHPGIRAVGFTGGLATGRILLGLINERADPIPFYGELGSLNPLVVTAAAAHARADAIAKGLFGSYTGSAGQLCTKPGVAFVPQGADGDRLVEVLAGLTREAEGRVLLNSRIASAFASGSARMAGAGGNLLAKGQAPDDDRFGVSPTLFTTSAAALGPELAEECFGPLIVVARYSDQDELENSLRRLPASLAATIHSEDTDDAVVRRLTQILEPQAGRIVYNGFPTGVRVSWAQHHGGPWPATNTVHTSVGVTAVRRFLRPFVWQNAPSSVLPEELTDDYRGIARRVDGKLVPADPQPNLG